MPDSSLDSNVGEFIFGHSPRKPYACRQRDGWTRPPLHGTLPRRWNGYPFRRCTAPDYHYETRLRRPHRNQRSRHFDALPKLDRIPPELQPKGTESQAVLRTQGGAAKLSKHHCTIAGRGALSGNEIHGRHAREPVLSAVDRVSEMLFGLFMALTFVGAVSVAQSGRNEIREMLIAAFGCNLAWGLVDAIMYLVGTIADRGRWLALARSVRSVDASAGHRHIAYALSRAAAGDLVSPIEIEVIRGRIIALPSVPERPALEWEDLLAALAIFLIVVGSTFPVVLPFLLIHDAGTAKNVSRVVALAMLFCGGLALGRYAGYSSWKAGLLMAGIGTVLVGAIIALGG
jgi:VIT1/CCC1 family predicted Fe2+/Mn2+ transporter